MTATTKAGLAAIIAGVGTYVAFGLTHPAEWLNPVALGGLLTAITTGLGLLFSKTGSPST